MAFAHTLLAQFTRGPETLGTTSKSYSNGQEVDLSFATTTGTTNEEHDFTITVANIVSCYLISDQAITLKFNSSSVPAPQIVLVANVPYFWNTDSYFTNLLTSNLTKVFVTNASGSTANWNFRFLVSG